MPVYHYRCRSCGALTEHLVSYSRREQPQDCPRCGESLGARYQFTPVSNLGQERVRGDKRLIWSEQQVAAEQGARWRDEGTTGRPGGAGRMLYFHD